MQIQKEWSLKTCPLCLVDCKKLRQDHPKIIGKSSENGTKNPQALAAGTAADSFCPTHRGIPIGGVTVGVVDLLRQGLGSTKIWNKPRFLLAQPRILWIHGCVKIPSLKKTCRPTRCLPKMSTDSRTFCSFHMWLWWIRKSTVFYLPIWRPLRWSILVHLLKLRWGGCEVGDCCGRVLLMEWYEDGAMVVVCCFFWLWNTHITLLTGRWEEVPEDCSRSAGWVPSKMLKNFTFLAAGWPDSQLKVKHHPGTRLLAEGYREVYLALDR